MKKKALSLFLAVCMAATSLPSSSFAAAREKFSADSVSSLASITYASFKDSPVSVINIQDLHFNPEAQNKIYGLLEKLGKTYPDMELYVEGASEKSNFDWVFSSLGKKNGELFLEALFKSGNLSGAEYFAAKNNKTVNPLEDKELYTQNLLLFAKLIEKRPETESFVAQDAKRLESLRSKYFSSRQKKLFDVYSKRSSGSIGDSEYFEYLKGECLRSGADLNDYPNISLYAEAYGSAQSASRKKLQAQMSKLFANLKNTLSYKEYSNLISASNNLQDKQALMNYLYKNRRQISLGNYPELDRFAASIALAGRINRVELIGEQDSLFKELSAKNFEDKNSENIMFISMFSEIYKKALTASATADEYEYYKSQISKYKSLMSQYVPENAFKALADTERDAQNFNDTNIKRSEVFVEKMFGQASPEKIYLESVFGVSAGAQAVLSSPSKVSVVIAGGFHTSQINDILGKRQISNVTFTPNILSPSGDYSSRYVEYAKTISNAENSAIQVPGLNEAVFAEFAKRVMDAVYKEKDLLSYDVKKEVEDIISARPELAKGSGAVKKIVSYSYDEQTGRQSAVYIDANDKEQTVYYVPETDSSAVKPGVNLTTLGKLTPAMVRIILRGATFGASDNIYNEFVNLAFYVGFGGSRDEIKEKILDKSFDYDKFFSLNPSKLGEFIAAAMSRTFNVNYAYAELLKTIKNIAVAQLSYYCNGVEVEILPSGSFINEGGYCLAALAANDDKKTATLYIDSAYLETLKGGSKADMENDLKDLIQHELYEQEALFDSKTDIYKAFTSYLNSIKVGEEGRITENFHKFLETEYFKLFMDSHPEAPTTYSGQKGLVKNAEGLQESILTKSYRDYRVRRYVEEIDSFENMDKKLQNDFVMLRLGDESTINEYAEKIENYIRDNDIVPKDEKKKYVIAVRKTEPEHIMQQLAEKVSKNLGIETIFLEQSDYMNYYAVHAHDDISSHKFDLNAKSARDVRGKNVIVLEDILKTGFTLREISKILNGARAQRVIPIAVFDAFYAVKFSKKNEEPAGRTFNANDYIKQFMQTDPQKAAGIIITLKGKTTKYLCYALNALLKEDPAAFFKVIERINADSDTANNMAYELIKIQKLYPQMSSAITPLIFAIVTGTSADKVKISDMPSLLGKIEAKCLKIEDCKGEMFVSQDELDGWGGAAWLIPAAARLSGYTKVKIAARKGVEYDKKQADMLLESAKRLGINAVYEYPFDELKMPEEFFALRQPIEKAASEFKNDMEKVRKKYDEAVLNYAKVQNDPGKNAREKAAAAQERKDAEEKYKKAVKGLLLAVDDLVRSQLPDFPVSRRDYSIVAGGSLAKGSFTSNSDIYYDIIAADEDIAAVLENNGFLQLYHYALSRSGINPYLSNGPKITYPGDIYGGFLENLIKADLSDESAAANFFDFEPAAQDNSPESRERNAAYKNYMEKTGKILLNKDKKGDETVKRDNLADDIAFLINEVSEPYFEMINKGAYNKKNGSVPNTFFGNVYAQAYNDKSEQYDLRWAIRGLDVMLKGILLKNIGKITDISQVPRETTALLAHLYGSGMLAEKNKGEADAIQNAVRTLYVARQQKAAAGKEYSWTAMTKAEEEALKTLKNFTAAHRADMRKLSPVNRERLNKLKEYSGAVSYALGRYSKEQLEKVLDKIRKYEKWSGNKYSPEMSVALLLSEIPYEEISTKVLGLNEGQNASPIMTSLALLRSAGSLPPVTKVKGDFAIQNYMDIILAMARSPQDMYAIFADKLFDVLDSVDEIAAKKAHEPGFKRLLDENKIADYYLGAGISALLDKLKGLDESGIRAFLKPEAAKTDMKELEESLEDSVKAANIIDRQKIIDAIFPENEENNAPFSELAGAKALAEMVKTANSSYFAFLSEAGKKTVSDEKTAAELTMYFVYIPLARRIGRVDVFEDMRNTIFEYAEPDAYLRIRSLLEKYIGGDEDGRYNETAAKYDRYDDNLTLLKTAVEKAMSGKEIAGRVKSRVKSLYSIYEKILSGRRDKSGSKKTKASDITLEDIKENIHDVFGLHVIVNDRNDMDKAKDAIEKLFESGQLKAAGLSLIDPDSGDLARIFDADIQKGFARTRYTFYYKGKQVGELVLYCEHEYQNEHDGLYTIPQNMLNAKDAGNFFIKFPLSHWIYKMGVNVANRFQKLAALKMQGKKIEPKEEEELKTYPPYLFRYADSVFAMRIAFEHLLKEDISREEQKNIFAQKDDIFYFYSDDMIFSDDDEANFRSLRNKLDLSSKKALFVKLGDGSYFPALMPFEFSLYDLASLEGLERALAESRDSQTFTGRITVTDDVSMTGAPSVQPDSMSATFDFKRPFAYVETDAIKQAASFYKRKFTQEEIDGLKLIRAKVLASLGGEEPGGMKPGEFFTDFEFGKFNEDLDSARAYAHSLGLKDENELYYAAEKNFIDETGKSKLKNYILESRRKDFEVEAKASDLAGSTNDEKAGVFKQNVMDIIGKILDKEETDKILTAPADSDFGKVALKISYYGDEEKLSRILEKIEADYKIVLPDKKSPGQKTTRHPVPQIYLVSLGQCVESLPALRGLFAIAKEGSVTAAQLLINIFSKSSVPESEYVKGGLLLKSEAGMMSSAAGKILEESGVINADSAVDIVVSGNPELLSAGAGAYAFATLGVADGKATIYVSDIFLKALSGKSDEERAFYLRQLAAHEAAEYAALKSGQYASYEKFHESLESNPDQTKLMEFAVSVAKAEAERRDRRETAESLGALLSRSDDDILSKENPADLLILCGNDEESTYEKALDLYASGKVKEILISGGQGRLTDSVRKKAEKRGLLSPGGTLPPGALPQDTDTLQKPDVVPAETLSRTVSRTGLSRTELSGTALKNILLNAVIYVVSFALAVFDGGLAVRRNEIEEFRAEAEEVSAGIRRRERDIPAEIRNASSGGEGSEINFFDASKPHRLIDRIDRYVADNLTDKEESALYSNKEERSRVRTILANALFIIAMGHYNNAYKIYSEMSALPDDAGDDRKKALKAKLQAALIDGNESFMFLPDGELKSNIKTLMKEAGLEDKDFENIAPEKIEKLIKDMCDGLARSVDVRDFYAKFYPNQDPNFTNAQYAERLNELEDYLREGSAYLTPEFYDKTREELDDLMARINPAYAAERMLSVKTLPQKLDFYFITMLKDVDYKLFWRTMKTKTFIVINDNKEQADWFVERLYPKSAGAILRFNTAAEALDAIKKLPNKKDIIVYTYIVMEKGSGLDLLKEAKEISEDIMVVAASAGVNDDNRMTLIRNGFDGAVGFEEYSATTNVLYYLILYGSMKNINISEDPQIVKDMVKFFLTPGWENKPIEEIERQFSVFNNSYSFDDWVEGETFSKIIAVRPTRPLALHYYKLLHDLYDKEMARGFNIVDKKAGDELSYLSHELWGDAFALRKTDPDLNKQANKLIAEADKLIKKRYNLKDKSTAGTVNMRFDFGLVDFIAKIIKKRFDSKKNAPVETAAAPYEKAVQKAAQSVPQSAAQSAPSVAKAIPVIDGKTIFIFDKNGTLTARKEAMTEDFAAWFLDFIKKHKTYIVSGANWKTLSAELPPDILGNLAGVYASLGNEFYDSSGKLANSNRFNPPIELFYMLQSFYRTTRYPGRLSDDPYKMEPGVLKFSVVMRGLPAEERAAYRRWDAERGERLMWKKQIEDKFPELQVVLGASIGMDIVPRGLGKERVLNELRADNEGAQIIYFGDEIESGNDKTISQMLDGGDKGYAFNVTGPEDTKKQITALLAAQPATAADAEAAKSGVVEENKKADADNLEILGRMVRNTWKAKDANTETSYAVKVALDGSLDEVETLKALEGFDKEYKPAYIEFVHAKFVETDSVTLGKKILKYESARGAVNIRLQSLLESGNVYLMDYVDIPGSPLIEFSRYLGNLKITRDEWQDIVYLIKALNARGIYHYDLEHNMFLERLESGKLRVVIIDWEHAPYSLPSAAKSAAKSDLGALTEYEVKLRNSGFFERFETPVDYAGTLSENAVKQKKQLSVFENGAVKADDSASKPDLSEAEMIKLILLDMARDKGLDPEKIKIRLDTSARNTKENFDNAEVKSAIEALTAGKKDAKPVLIAVTQISMQQFRALAAGNLVLENYIRSGIVKLISATNSEFYKGLDTDALVFAEAGELMKLIVHSVKPRPDTLPSVNDQGNKFASLPAEVWTNITALIETSSSRKDLCLELREIITQTRDNDTKETIFKSKQALLDALSDKLPADSEQFAAMKQFISLAYEPAGSFAQAAEAAASTARKAVSPTAALRLAQKAAISKANVPDYLKDSGRAFVFDLNVPAENMDLIAYMGSYSSKSFALAKRRNIAQEKILFTFNVAVDGEQVPVNFSLEKTQTGKGFYYELRYSYPFFYDERDEAVKSEILKAVFENSVLRKRLATKGLNLKNAKEGTVISSLPSDPKLLTAEAKSAAIAREAGVSAQLRRVKSKARAAGVYNEKLPVSAMPAGSYNTGIGELTSLNSYVERVLKEAGVRGFTMQDLHSPKNTMAGNWLLIDWLSVPGAAGIITKEDIAADISENENVSAQAVAERKTAAAKKVYEKLNDEQKAAVDNYYAANASWLDGYKDANDASYVKVAAMQQMFFERQLKQILSQINGMRVSMRLSGVTSANAKQVLGKWIDLGITSFTVEAERIDKAALDAIAAAASESGMTIDIAVKADAKDFNSAKKIFEAGFTPVVPLRDMNKYGVEARSAIAEIDNDSLKANPDLAKFLAENVSSGARYVEYPIGLLWGDKIDFEKFEEYRVPAQSKRKGLGSLFGLGQKTFEESYAGSYETAYSKGRNDIDVSDASFDASSLASVNVKINGQFKSIPAAAAAALLGSMAKQRRLSSIEDFATTSLSVMKALGSEKTLAPAFKYVYEALTSYNNEKDSQRKEIIEAKVAGFICGLSENLIISNAGSKFISEDLAGMYAKIVAEKSLFDAGIYPAGLDGNITAVEKIMLKADAVLAEKTLKLSAGEIKPLLSNLILAAEKTNFTFGSLDFGNLGFDKNRSAELSKVYAGAAEIMKLVFADAKVQEDSVKKSVAKIQLDAFKTMLAAA